VLILLLRILLEQLVLVGFFFDRKGIKIYKFNGLVLSCLWWK